MGGMAADVGRISGLNVGIAGMGLIGGSIAAALAASGSVRGVFAWDVDRIALETAVSMGFEFHPCRTAAELASSSEVLIIAVPLRYMEEVSMELRPLFDKVPAAVMDVGSTKEEIGRKLADIWGKVYIGLHPMAGKEYSGIENASADLFGGADCAIVVPAEADRVAAEIAEEMVAALGARAVYLEAGEHDRILACISHLPTVLASSLSLLAGEEMESHLALTSMVGGGFRDTSRVASGPAWLAADMWSTNHENMDVLLDKVIKILQDFKNSSPAEFEALAEKGRICRENILDKRRC